MNIGFTGTRKGMTRDQRDVLMGLMRARRGLVTAFHHGGAAGADREAATLASTYGWPVVPHLPAGHRSEDYLARNREIVDASDELIATPGDMGEELRSGTWATIRYARRRRKMVTVVWPDGTLQM